MFVMTLLSEAGPDTSLAWVLWMGLAFFFLMVVVGWLASSRRSG